MPVSVGERGLSSGAQPPPLPPYYPPSRWPPAGLYCCGPAPVRAVREGEVLHPHDAPFVFAMVNADRVAWLLSGAKKEKLHWDGSSIGCSISTKALGSQEREDLTATYKHPEGLSIPPTTSSLDRLPSRTRGKCQEGGEGGPSWSLCRLLWGTLAPPLQRGPGAA